MAEFTGERVIPGQVEPDLWNEHAARYAFAARYAAGRRVLDAGCGSGYGTAELAKMAAHAVGMDISAEAVGYAREHYTAPNLEFFQASCTALPVRTGSVEIAVAFEVIEHLEDWRSLLDELRRVLAPGGLLIISTPNKAYYAEARRLTGPNPYHVHEFEFEQFSAELRGRFPHVEFFLQNHVAAIGFQPLDPARSAGIESYAASCAGQPQDAHFYLAVCSAEPLPPPPAFLYVPSTANILRERELHIEKLEVENKGLIETLRALNEELERSNAWAKELDRKFHTELEQAIQWAKSLESQLEAKGKELLECVRLLDAAEATVQERTEWALRLDSELKVLREQLSAVKASRWLKLGRALGLGPVLPND
ncbi:MAG TPA: methyltransferase domain-containing protein [Bryobacteraceae bacterium]|nr:methyltransferase domain-containing protein [Bryobacteraceae bacterium]HPQ16612.1 methyltransferase domain-containing protein [Bryobacteraceae bacterium]